VYVSRINRVIDHIDKHLDQPMKLETLAEIAHFSPFHFHRIFRALVGETLNHFIQRIRLEKAASMLLYSSSKSVTEIALDCGFSGSAPFARAFKDLFGMSASEWRSGGTKRESKIGQTDDKIDQTDSMDREDFDIAAYYLDSESYNVKWRIKMRGKLEANVEVKKFPEMHVAYVRHIGPYKGDSQLFENLFNKLFRWAGPRNLLSPDAKIIAMYHDNPDITDEDKLRTDVCVTVPAETEVDGEIGKSTIPAGQYAVGHFELDPDQYEQAWNLIYGGWLPDSGYQPDDRPCFELYLNDPKKHPENKCVVDICVAVKPM
jgi:AraC family transcriptional regulator